ncbi:MAG: hypothetical protein K0S32_4118 [Bacteroidetes bacterium]|nr:hypothetical protein [Bacteroidota bacterium]
MLRPGFIQHCQGCDWPWKIRTTLTRLNKLFNKKAPYFYGALLNKFKIYF